MSISSVLVAMAALLVLFSTPALSSQEAPEDPSSFDPIKPLLSPVETVSPPVERSTGAGLYLMAPTPIGGSWSSEFNAWRYPGWSRNPREYLLQRGVYTGRVYGLMAEMGDLRIAETTNTIGDISRRGARLGVRTGNAAHTLELQGVATSGLDDGASYSQLMGATGELSLLDGSVRFKTIYFSSTKSLPRPVASRSLPEKRGEVVGFVAVIEPWQGKLVAEGELNFAQSDSNTADSSAAVRDTACRVKVSGRSQACRYRALYERTGADYRTIGGDGPKRDWEGVALGLETDLQPHVFELSVSRYNNNTANSDLYARLYRYEALLDYTFKGIDSLPLGLQYRKTYIDSEREPDGYAPKLSDEDTFSGRLAYVAERWEIGVKGSFLQRTDKVRGELEATATSFSLLPRMAAGPVTVAPELSLKRKKDATTGAIWGEYAINLGITGSAFRSKLDYEVKGGYKKEWTGSVASAKDTFGANMRAAYPLGGASGGRPSSIGLKGEYSGVTNRASDRSTNSLSLLFSVEGSSDLLHGPWRR